MKFLIVMLSAIVLNFNLLANASDEMNESVADQLYALREESVEHALRAADIYRDLMAQTENRVTVARMAVKRSQALYYYGSQVNKKSAGDEDSVDKKVIKLGAKAADVAVKLLAEPESEEEEKWKMSALFWSGTNWLSTRTLGNAKKGKATMEKIIKAGYEDIYHYGPHRVLGRLRFRAPSIISLGNKKVAKVHLKTAFENTLVSDEVQVSVYGPNNIYYADSLMHSKQREQACEILQIFAEQDPETLMPNRVAETRQEMEWARSKWRSFRCNR